MKRSVEININDINRIITQNKAGLYERFGVVKLGVFGSFTRGMQKADSDIDILVEFERPIGIFSFIRLENEITRFLGVKVDLVTKDALKPRIKERVNVEVVYI